MSASSVIVTSPIFLPWDDRWHLGHRAMDHAHEEFAHCVNALLASDDAALPPALERLLAHLVEHFGQEERLMDEHRFPGAGCHADEHARVLESAREVQAQAAAGEHEPARAFALALVDWFPGHSDHLDSALSIWIARRRTQGAPLVLRRSSARLRSAAPVAG